MTENSIHMTTHNRLHTPRWHFTTVTGAAFERLRTTDDNAGVHLPIMTENSIHVTTRNRLHTPRWHLPIVAGAAFE